MNSIVRWVDKAFTNKQDMQAFVLLMLILFIIFTKFYIVATGGDSLNTALPMLHNKDLFTASYVK